MTPDTMLAAGWPAHMLLHARAIERVASYATLERGWYCDLNRGRTKYVAGGPTSADAIREAAQVIAWCATHGIVAPSVYPTPLANMTSGVSLEWDTPNVWAEWVAPGVWEVVAGEEAEMTATTAQVCAMLKAAP